MTNARQDVDLSRLHDAAVEAALRGGAAIMGYFRSPDCRIEHKSDGSPVTSADLAAESIILSVLRNAVPSLTLISEESVAAADSPDLSGPFLLVDPLDGTREFAKGSPEFTVNIALVSAGRPHAGLIYAPALSEIYATLSDGTAAWAHIAPPIGDAPYLPSSADLAWQPLARPAATNNVRPGRRLLASPRDHAEVVSWLARTHQLIDTHIDCGSSYKFCLIARGDADLYPRFGPTSEWDTAAGQAIIEATGGSVRTSEHAPLSYGKCGAGLLNPPFLALGPEVAGSGLWPLKP